MMIEEYNEVQRLSLVNISVIRVDIPIGSVVNENVYAVDKEGIRLWIIKYPEHHKDEGKDNPVVHMKEEDGFVVLSRWDSSEYRLDILTGELTSLRYTK